MKKFVFLMALSLVIGLTLYIIEGKAQMGPGMMGPGYGYGYRMGPEMMEPEYGYGYRMGPEMMEPEYGYGYRMGPGMMGGWVTVPDKLPTPKNVEWIQKLREILVLEKNSYAQYTIDAEKYNAAMPYMMVIPQEEDHVNLIERLFLAYGLKSDGKPEPTVETKSLKEAFELCSRMEQELIPRYTWLVQNAEDQDSAQVLNNILLQTRMHLAMFQHTLGMGGYGMGPGMMRGRGMGPGMMGPGMRGWGMGPGYGYQYGPQYQRPQKPLEKQDAKVILENYLKSTRNPNLKIGRIEDKGNDFEAEILTQKDSLVEKILIDKNTGWMRSVY